MVGVTLQSDHGDRRTVQLPFEMVARLMLSSGDEREAGLEEMREMLMEGIGLDDDDEEEEPKSEKQMLEEQIQSAIDNDDFDEAERLQERLDAMGDDEEEAEEAEAEEAKPEEDGGKREDANDAEEDQEGFEEVD